MKAVVLSVRPKWVEKIASGKKTIEVRKTAPKEVPFKVYIYCTAGADLFLNMGKTISFKPESSWSRTVDVNQKVVGEFICDKIYPIKGEYYDGGSAERRRKSIETFLPGKAHNELVFATCLDTEELFDYIGNGKWGYGWHISNLKIYDKPTLTIGIFEYTQFYPR